MLQPPTPDAVAHLFKARIQHHLFHQPNPEPLGGMGLCKKRRRTRKSQALRYARCAARKDANVFRSSRGKFSTVAELAAHRGGAK